MQTSHPCGLDASAWWGPELLARGEAAAALLVLLPWEAPSVFEEMKTWLVLSYRKASDNRRWEGSSENVIITAPLLMQITTFLSHFSDSVSFSASLETKVGNQGCYSYTQPPASFFFFFPNRIPDGQQFWFRWTAHLAVLGWCFGDFKSKQQLRSKNNTGREAIKYWNSDGCAPESCLRKNLMNFKGLQTYLEETFTHYTTASTYEFKKNWNRLSGIF